MKILFIGGYGNISWWCTKRAIEQGNEVVLLNRGQTYRTRRPIPDEARVIVADIRDAAQTRAALGDESFDAVCDFLCYDAEDARRAIALFTGRTKQYVFVSSESVYRRLSSSLPFSETAPKYDLAEASPYIAGKLAAEQVFIEAQERTGFPLTIVRPGLTYDTIVPVSIGHNCFTVPQRCLDGKPLYVAGEGNNLCAFTHSRDFADPFCCLLGNPACIGEDYNIATNQWRTWNEASEDLLDALHVEHRRIIHIPFDDVLRLNLPLAPGLMRERMLHLIFDTSKIRRIAKDWTPKVDFPSGIRMTVAWLYETDAHRRIVPKGAAQMAALDEIYAKGGRDS